MSDSEKVKKFHDAEPFEHRGAHIWQCHTEGYVDLYWCIEVGTGRKKWIRTSRGAVRRFDSVESAMQFVDHTLDGGNAPREVTPPADGWELIGRIGGELLRRRWDWAVKRSKQRRRNPGAIHPPRRRPPE
jgi:hypothetical protein